jgi:hypothetical protein
MKRVVSFYEKLPRGPAPKVEAKGLLGRYQAKHFGGDNASAKRTCSLDSNTYLGGLNRDLESEWGGYNERGNGRETIIENHERVLSTADMWDNSYHPRHRSYPRHRLPHELLLPPA